MAGKSDQQTTIRRGSTFLRVQRAFFNVDHAAYAAGFNDFVRSIEAILLRADQENFNWRVYWVAALGFLTDSYNLFASNVVLPALSYVYWNTPQRQRQNGFNIATLIGSMVGQVVFGVAVDVYGRRALYGFELLIVIISTLGLLQCSSGFRDDSGETTWSITTWLFCWRVVMGIGIGAEYPLSACIAAEWSSKKSRARMMSAVFFMQPLGHFLAYTVGLITISQMSSSRVDIDKFWRIVIGVGTIPTLLALIARRFLPESWRFTFFVTKNPGKALGDSHDVYPSKTNSEQEEGLVLPEMQEREIHINAGVVNHTAIVNGDLSPLDTEAEHRPNGHHVSDSHIANGQSVHAPVGHDLPSVTYAVSEADEMIDTPAWQPGEQFEGWQFWQFLWDNRAPLAGTSICWFLLDVAFYGMGFNSPGTLAKLWTDRTMVLPQDAPWWQTNSDIANVTAADGTLTVINGLNRDGTIAETTINEIIKSTMTHAIYTTSIAAIVGSALFIGTAHLLNRKKMLIWTFFAVAVVLAIISAIIRQLFHDGVNGARPLPGGHYGLVVFWALAQFLFNFGPNTLTFILPAEIFPTRYRCTCYGIAAAIGKLGAVVVQAAIWAVPSDPNNYTSLQWLMASFSVCMALGGVVAMIPGAIPDVQEGLAGLENKSLEALSDDGDLIKRPTSDDSS